MWHTESRMRIGTLTTTPQGIAGALCTNAILLLITLRITSNMSLSKWIILLVSLPWIFNYLCYRFIVISYTNAIISQCLCLSLCPGPRVSMAACPPAAGVQIILIYAIQDLSTIYFDISIVPLYFMLPTSLSHSEVIKLTKFSSILCNIINFISMKRLQNQPITVFKIPL